MFFYCRRVNISRIKHIDSILSYCTLFLLQENWLLPREVSTLNTYFKDYNTHGISGIINTVPLLGRP